MRDVVYLSLVGHPAVVLLVVPSEFGYRYATKLRGHFIVGILCTKKKKMIRDSKR
jgi:hypothetical protein